MALDNLVGKGLEKTAADADGVARYLAMIESKLKTIFESMNCTLSINRLYLAYK
jgi:hypothetical protein